jgi:hypothetical protein
MKEAQCPAGYSACLRGLTSRFRLDGHGLLELLPEHRFVGRRPAERVGALIALVVSATCAYWCCSASYPVDGRRLV